tara:strand:+ start:233 stop:775 length:543 start_codon:yes stop_codon:yes gene_type:complete
MAKRSGFSKFQIEVVRGKQKNKCANYKQCKTKFTEHILPEYDHINGNNYDNRTENLQLLCSNCHGAKSRKENQERSIKKKDSVFVKFCPFCGHGDKNNEVAANEKAQCTRCSSIFKILRYEPKVGEKKIRTKKHEDIVRYCAHCGEEFGKISSNIYFKHEECKTIMAVSVLDYKKLKWYQ